MEDNKKNGSLSSTLCLVCQPPDYRPRQRFILDQLFSNFNFHMILLGILLKMQILMQSVWGGPEVLHSNRPLDDVGSVRLWTHYEQQGLSALIARLDVETLHWRVGRNVTTCLYQKSRKLNFAIQYRDQLWHLHSLCLLDTWHVY